MCTACELQAPVKVEYVNPKLNKTPTMLIGNETLPCFGHLPLEFHQYGIKYSTFHGYRPNNEIKFVNNAKNCVNTVVQWSFTDMAGSPNY